MSACVEDYKAPWVNITPYPIADRQVFSTKSVDAESLEEENQTMITARKANAMIRD